MTEIDTSLPHYEVRKFLASETLSERAVPSPARDARIAELLSLPVGPAYSADLNVIVAELNKLGWWWHLSHLEAQVTPTRPAPGMEGLVSNGATYDAEGRTVSYTSHFSKDSPAMAICEAWIKAAYDLPDAFYTDASAIEEALKRKPMSHKSMMAYYKAHEKRRLENIRRFASRTGPTS